MKLEVLREVYDDVVGRKRLRGGRPTGEACQSCYTRQPADVSPHCDEAVLHAATASSTQMLPPLVSRVQSVEQS